MKKLRSDSKEVRAKVREHMLEAMHDLNENKFDTLEEAAKYLNSEFYRVMEYDMENYPKRSLVAHFHEYMFTVPFNFFLYTEDVVDYLNGLGLNPEGKEFPSEKSWWMYHYMIYSEMLKAC